MQDFEGKFLFYTLNFLCLFFSRAPSDRGYQLYTVRARNSLTGPINDLVVVRDKHMYACTDACMCV